MRFVLIGSGLQFLFVAACLVAVVLIIRQRRMLGNAAAFGAIGFSALAGSTITHICLVSWPIIAIERGLPFPFPRGSAILALFTWTEQSLGLGGIVLVIISVLCSRPGRYATPNNTLERPRGQQLR
jgi:hypothetical protein